MVVVNLDADRLAPAGHTSTRRRLKVELEQPSFDNNDLTADAMARATPKLLDEDATEPDAPVEEAPVPGYSIAMARARAMGEVAVDNGLRFDFSARDASRRSSFSGADNGILAAEPDLLARGGRVRRDVQRRRAARRGRVAAAAARGPARSRCAQSGSAPTSTSVRRPRGRRRAPRGGAEARLARSARLGVEAAVRRAARRLPLPLQVRLGRRAVRRGRARRAGVDRPARDGGGGARRRRRRRLGRRPASRRVRDRGPRPGRAWRRAHRDSRAAPAHPARSGGRVEPDGVAQGARGGGRAPHRLRPQQQLGRRYALAAAALASRGAGGQRAHCLAA